MLEKGIISHSINHNRVDIKLTQTNDIGLLLNAINTVEISKELRINQFFIDGEADF